MTINDLLTFKYKLKIANLEFARLPARQET